MLIKLLGLENDERVLKAIHQHWFVFVGYVLILAVLALAPAVLLGSIPFLPPSLKANISITSGGPALVQFVYSVWLLLLWIAFFLRWTSYYLNVMLITNKRVIGIQQFGLFNRRITSLRFENIQDIRIDILGIISTTLDFGHVIVEAAGEHDEVEIKNAARPEDVKHFISELQEDVMNKRRFGNGV